MGDFAKKLKELRSAHWYLKNTRGNAKYCVGNIINNIVVTKCGAGGILEISEEHCVKCVIAYLRGCTPETNTK